MTDRFKIGDTVDLYDREFEITGYHDKLIIGIEKQVAFDEDGNDIGYETEESTHMTVHDLEHHLKELDGYNHHVIIE